MTQNRTGFIGGSDTAAVLGVSPWKSRFLLYQEKIGEYEEKITPAKQKIFNRGKRWEPVVIEMLVDELHVRGHQVKVLNRNEYYSDSEFSFMRAEIDLELMIDGEFYNGEMKTVHPFAAKDWGEEGTDEIPIYYTAQIAHGQMVTGKSKTIVAALIGADDLRVHFVDRDDELINLIRQKEIEFWGMVQDRNPPDPSTDSDIKFLYSVCSDECIPLSVQIIDAIRNINDAKKQIKMHEKIKDLNESAIKLSMGNAKGILNEGKPVVTWKNNKDSIKTDWRDAFYSLVSESTLLGQADIAKIIEASTETKPGARVLRIK